MNTVYLQPPFALQRAEELISVNQMSEAFDILYATVSDKRFRNTHFDSAAQQDVIEKFLELAVLLDQLRLAREVLSQYRSLCQHSFSVTTALEHGLTHMREVAEKQVANSETDPTRMNTSVAICIEVYKIIIEFARFSLRMQTVCHETVHSAFRFCCRYNQKNHFHRICDTIKSYTTMMQKMKQRGSVRHTPLPGEEHRGPQLEIKTNFYQLKYAVKLNSWREIMQAADDLYTVGLLDFVGLKPDSSVQTKQLYCTAISAYFECLAHYYAQVGMFSLHATAMMRWAEHLLNQYVGLSQRERTLICSVCVLAALSIGAHRGAKSKEEGFDSATRRKHSELLSTAALLHSDKILQFLRSKNIVAQASQEVRNLLELVSDSDYFWVEIAAKAMSTLDAISVEFKDFTSTALDEICLVDYNGYPQMVSRYFQDIKRVIFRSTIKKCSRVYKTMRLDQLKANFTANGFMSEGTVLLELVNIDSDLGLHIQIDAMRNSVDFYSKRNADVLLSMYHQVIEVSLGLNRVLLEWQQAVHAAEEEREWKKLMAQSTTADADAEALQKVIAKCSSEQENYIYAYFAKKEQARESKAQSLRESENQRALYLTRGLEASQVKRQLTVFKRTCARKAIEKMIKVVEGLGATPESFTVVGVPLSKITERHLVSNVVTMQAFSSAIQDYIQKYTQKQKLQLRKQSSQVECFARALHYTKLNRLEQLIEQKNKEIEAERQMAAARLTKVAAVIERRDAILLQHGPKVLQWLNATANLK